MKIAKDKKIVVLNLKGTYHIRISAAYDIDLVTKLRKSSNFLYGSAWTVAPAVLTSCPMTQSDEAVS